MITIGQSPEKMTGHCLEKYIIIFVTYNMWPIRHLFIITQMYVTIKLSHNIPAPEQSYHSEAFTLSYCLSKSQKHTFCAIRLDKSECRPTHNMTSNSSSMLGC